MRWPVGIVVSLLTVVVVNLYFMAKAMELERADPVVESYHRETR